MTDREAIDVLINEWKCIARNDGIHCDRKCESCDLVMDVEVIREAYSMAISALQAQEAKHSTESSLTQNGLDTISRTAAIDAIVKWAESNNENPDGDDCIMIILELPSAQPEPQWIPTAKRLPEIKQRVLITYNTEDGLKTDVTWYDTYGFMLSENVTAWMPMVEPYRAERRTDERDIPIEIRPLY